ncbi:MAG: hypothetical protein WC699_02730 [Bacteroidales bacterium]
MLNLRILILIAGLSLLQIGECSAQSVRDKLLTLARNNTSDGSEILERAGDFEFEKFLNSRDSAGLLEGFGTVVHESCHQLNHLISMKNSESFGENLGFFITKGVEIVAERGPVFNSTKLNGIVPKNLQKQIFRYYTYIGEPRQYLGSQVDGVYGMLDEFCAYYQGTKASFELYDFYYKYRCNGYKNALEWANYVQHIASSAVAYYEFRMFISWYLDYAKQHDPKVYNSCMRNTHLRIAYTLIDNLYGPLVRDFNTMLEDLAVKLSKGNIKAEFADYENEKSFIIRTQLSPSRTSTQVFSVFSNEINLLNDLLEGKQNGILEDFRIKGATVENYQSYF